MLKYDADQLKAILINREGYSEAMAELEVDNLWRLNGELQEALDQWMEDGTVSKKVEVEGFTIDMVMRKKGVSGFLDALGYISIFIKDPEYAELFRSWKPIRRGRPFPPENKHE